MSYDLLYSTFRERDPVLYSDVVGELERPSSIPFLLAETGSLNIGTGNLDSYDLIVNSVNDIASTAGLDCEGWWEGASMRQNDRVQSIPLITEEMYRAAWSRLTGKEIGDYPATERQTARSNQPRDIGSIFGSLMMRSLTEHGFPAEEPRTAVLTARLNNGDDLSFSSAGKFFVLGEENRHENAWRATVAFCVSRPEN